MKKKIFSLAMALSTFFGVNAQEWTLPIIGEDISTISESTELYMYNVKADAFACAGMSWGTHAIVKELQNGDKVLSAGIHNCKITRPEAERVKISLNGREWLGGGGPASTNDCWVDHAQNNLYIYNNIGNNTYTLKPTTATNDSYLDCSWAYGGHITFSATNGYGNTEWAFVKRENITNGKYLLYKAKKEMYDIYEAVVAAGHDDTYSNALSIAYSAYTSASATAETVKEATKELLSEVAPALTQGFYPVNSLFDSPDMRGAGDDDKWGNGLNAFGDGIFESWHSAETITQKKTGLPNGFYTVVFHGIYRQDGSDAAPTLKLTSGTNSAVANLKAITDIDFGKCNGGNKWTGENKPDDKYTAGEALTHTDAVVRVENFVVENGELTVTVSMPSASQWLLCQGFEIFYKAESVEEYANLFKASKAAAEAIDKNALNEAAKNILNTALENAEAEVISKDWYNERIQELDYAVALAKVIAAQMPTANALVATCESYLENSTPKQASNKTAFETAIDQAKSEVNGATTAEALTKAINDLEAARQVYVVSATPNGVTFDLNFKMTNNWINGGNTYNAGGVTMRERYFEDVYRTGDMMTQTISGLANGIYNVELYANANWTPNRGNIKTAAADAGAEVSSVFANEITAKVPLAHQTTTATAGQYKLEGVEVKDGTINLGIRNDANGANWILIAPKSLTFVSALDLSELIATLTNDLERANAINGKMSTAAQQQLAAAIEGADVNSDNPDELDRMISELQKAIAVAETSIGDYAKIKTYIDKANEIDESIAASYQTQYDNGTLVGDAETIRQELNVATFKYVEDNFKNEIALTEWGAESNAMWSTSGEHWDGTSGEGCTSYYDANGTNTTHTLSKEVELTPGTYVFRAAGRSNANTELSLSISIDGVDPVIFNAKGNTGRGIDKTGNATFADDAEYARDGQGQGWEWEFIKFTLNEKTTVTLTATSKTTGWGWASFANNGLWMDDATYLIANASALEKPMATAQELLDQPMNVEKKTALQEAMDLSATTVTEFNAKIASLETAIDEAKISIEEYKEILTYINKANKIDESIAASYQTQYDKGTIEGSVEVVFQALEIATYNYVKDNFTYDVALSDTWNSTGTNTKAWDASGEHWDGNNATTYKNQYDGWGDPKQGYPANSWSIDFNQEVALPAGEYVFKVAGRKSVDATLELNVTKGETVLGTVNDFPSSNNTLGINKAGAASFDAEDQAGFANNGSGFGWQWRYVKFTLTENSTVKVAVHAETNKIYNWVSFGNYTLQMTEETYMAAGQPELDAALDAAQALVGTKPMGTDEETALNEAIALPVTTGAEQKAKVNALNTAVENIKTWRATYYAEKDKLVAALERFETDYNDAENGSLDYMNKNRWATVIEKAQAAAVAKDNQTSHAVLTTATNELTEALDAATVSVNEYAALKSAINEAKTLVAANVGDQPFERPQSAADAISTTEEQALYNEATADGEDVTSVTDALTEGIATFNNTPLNAPKEGQRFYIKVATEGHSKLGNAVLATLGATNANNPTGYGLNCNNPVKGYLNQAFAFTQVEGNLYNISIERTEGTVYLTYGSLNGSAAGWKNQQIQATTDDAKKGEFKIEATTKEGVLKILNTIDNNYLDCQNGGSIYTDTGIQSEEFNFELASEHTITLTISSAKWSTLILPFNAELPEGVKAYTCAGVIDGVLTFNEASTIEANTPYLVGGNAGKYDFSGYGLADKDVYTEGLFTGTYVDYQTEAGKHIYVLQKHDNEVAFYEVRESAQPWVRANRCYITYESASEARVLRLGFDDTSGIDNVLFPTDNSELTIYDTMGRKVKSMKKGSLYIINGKKVVVK